jgi:hypothetical protein
VLSLDFELAWGVRDVLDVAGAYRGHLLGVREVVPRLLERFAAHDVAATWATVGLLFAESRDEALARAPAVRPAYVDPRLDPYRALEGGEVGDDERRDPLHYAASLVRLIAAAPRQELGSHTYAHLYPMEPGVAAEAIAADLAAARAMGQAHGHDLRSLVMPRHQVRAVDLPLVAAAGFAAHRGPEPNALNRPRPGVGGPLALRAGRVLDAYLPLTGANDAAWPVPDAHGLVDVPEARFLRPASARLRALEPLRVARVVGAMEAAARRGTLCHVWWHPHNFGADPAANLANLDAVLEAYARLRDAYGFASWSMGGVADAVGARAQASGAVARDRPAPPSG